MPAPASLRMDHKRSIVLISTGGTIEKTYDELSGVLANQVSVLDVMLASLELRGDWPDRAEERALRRGDREPLVKAG